MSKFSANSGENMKSWILAALAATLTACAGTSFNWDDARRIREGMTEQEITALMGAPYLVKSTADGQTWVWSHADAFSGAKSVSVVMKDGKVVRAPSIPESFR